MRKTVSTAFFRCRFTGDSRRKETEDAAGTWKFKCKKSEESAEQKGQYHAVRYAYSGGGAVVGID